ncbi:unnamed protein product [Ceutorhynchus assimilis]|uniref:Protein-serine O-palmitoleoyltransferase porcupine n=1 Tax=Ceutorhynchus assimilis TaxID=467358 RepID=A0A9N9MDM5_9CUCU|nr:unnamed protein product [Ceutorhynchus assimilis]
MDALPDIYQSKESIGYKNELELEYFQETFYDVWENCVIESYSSLYHSIHKPFVLNVIFGLLASFGLPEILFHWLTALCGGYMLVTTMQSTTGLIVIFSTFILAYVPLFCMKYVQSGIHSGENYSNQQTTNSCSGISATLILYGLIAMSVLFEYVLLDKEISLEIRGVMMVFSMKFISLVADLPAPNLPSFPEYFGYVFCSGNILFGPWISFEQYMLQVNFPTQKNLNWIFGVSKALSKSLIFLSISNCWASFFIGDNRNSLLTGYKEAISVRTGHYFICYVSEAFMLAAGWKDVSHHFEQDYWTFSVTNFMKIEFPTSLAAVVVNWNKPMHEFLKKYIYRKWLPTGKFQAVLLTFVISSLFHGFEIKVSTVLISLGVFSYLQILVREHISQAFNICVKIHTCKSCQHKIKRDSIICKLALIVFSFFTILHLIFLGVLMDQSTDEVGIYQKWYNLYFFSLWIMLLNLLVVK